MYQDYTLIVNGKEKPWPTDNVESPVTIDLNWGLDTNYYEAEVVSFTLKDLIAGQQVKNVRLDAAAKQVICTIPIVEKTKCYRVVLDWSPIKKQVLDGLTAEVNGKPRKLEDGSLVLSGRDLSANFDILYDGIKCDVREDDANKLCVTLPKYKYKSETWRKRSLIGWLCVFLPGILLSCVVSLILWELGVLNIDGEEQNSHANDNYVEEVIVVDNSIRAREYLRNNNSWNRKEMLAIDTKLVDLYDALNEFRFSEVARILEELEVQNDGDIEGLYNYVKNAMVSMDGVYCTDGTITPNYYIEWIGQHQKEREYIKSKCAPNSNSTRGGI